MEMVMVAYLRFVEFRATAAMAAAVAALKVSVEAGWPSGSGRRAAPYTASHGAQSLRPWIRSRRQTAPIHSLNIAYQL
jgi:hypothetical protein